MGEIKSALEIAMEKADRLGRTSREEIKKDERINTGRRLAARYINGETEDLKAALSEFEAAVLPDILNGATDALLRNIVLPRDKDQLSTIRRAMKGIVDIKGSPANQVLPQMEDLLSAFEQTRDHYRDQLKAQFQGRLGEVQQAVAMQYGSEAASSVDVEALPEFQQEWTRLSGELNDQFEQKLDEMKVYIRRI
ncbi:MAG TPA: hypothetical protein EYP57_09530 [Thermodesulfobacteriaceae bacterium]|nr:hypothetical protein [Thermodesulfobacteriaceae bacterium]